MKLPAKTKLGFLLIAAGLAFAVWAVWIRARNAAPLLSAGNIGPTFNNDERATEILAKVNTEFAEDDAKERLTGYIAAASAVRPPSRGSVLGGSVINPTDQFRFERELEAAYRNSGAYRDLDYQTFASYARGTSTNASANQPFAGFFGLLGLNANN